MLQFFQSIWLWASAGIIAPVVIHLWNVKQGKTLKVGSIALFTPSAKSHAKSFKLSDILLLLLRCLLLIVLAMLIAKPFFVKQSNLQKENGWFLIEKSHVQEVYKNYKTTIDSLIKSGYTFHYFNSGFAEAKFEDVLKRPPDTITDSRISYWTLLKELDQKVPLKLPVFLFTDNLAKQFYGNRPSISLNLKWKIYPSADTISTWIEKAFKTTRDSIRLIVGNSHPTGTYFTYQNTSGTSPDFRLSAVNGKTFVSYNDTSKNVLNKPLEVDTSTMIISVFTDNFSTDATYLQAAINAVKDFTKYKIKVAVVNEVKKIDPNFDWLFWMSEEPIPASLVKNNVFLYEKGKIENARSQILTKDKDEVTLTDGISLFKSVQNTPKVKDEFEPVWKNGFGQAVLSVEKKSATIYHFYSRFDPQWNDLPWSNQFPQIIYNLLFNNNTNINRIADLDKRVMDAAQIEPVITPAEGTALKAGLTEKKDLSNILWILAFVLIFVERILSFKTKKEEVYG